MLCAVLLVPAASAQTRPDAGSILNEIERSLPPLLPQRERPRPALSAPAGAVFHVAGFRISGAAPDSVGQLQPLLADFVGRDRSLADLNRAADAVTRYYRERGHFLSRAYVPAQKIEDGIVEIAVLEAPP